MERNIFIVKQVTGDYAEDLIYFNVKAFINKDDADNYLNKLVETEELEQIQAEKDGEYIEYSSFSIDEITIEDGE